MAAAVQHLQRVTRGFSLDNANVGVLPMQRLADNAEQSRLRIKC